MRESRTYGSVRGACDETHVPTATWRDVAIGTSRHVAAADGRFRTKADSYAVHPDNRQPVAVGIGIVVEKPVSRANQQLIAVML